MYEIYSCYFYFLLSSLSLSLTLLSLRILFHIQAFLSCGLLSLTRASGVICHIDLPTQCTLPGTWERVMTAALWTGQTSDHTQCHIQRAYVEALHIIWSGQKLYVARVFAYCFWIHILLVQDFAAPPVKVFPSPFWFVSQLCLAKTCSRQISL